MFQLRKLFASTVIVLSCATEGLTADTEYIDVLSEKYTYACYALKDVLSWKGQTREADEIHRISEGEMHHFPVRPLGKNYLTGLMKSLKDLRTPYEFHSDAWLITDVDIWPEMNEEGKLFLVTVPDLPNKESFRGGAKLPLEQFWAQFGYVEEGQVENNETCELFWIKFLRTTKVKID